MKSFMPLIVGNDELCERLVSDVRNGSLSHAYIIEGEVGSGRKTLALNVAAATACENRGNPAAPLPCGECPSCKKILAKKSTDVIFIDKEDDRTTIGVNTARFIREDVHIVPNDIEDKFYVIKNSDILTEEAQNALLLTFEEPPAFAHFFLISTNASNLLETVRSRAITVRTERLAEEQIADYLCKTDARASQMKLSAPNEFSELIKASRSGIGQAIEYLEPSSWKPVAERRELVRKLISDSLSKKSAQDILQIFRKISSKRDVFTEFLTLFNLAVRDLILMKKTDAERLEFFCDPNEAIELADKVTLHFLYTLYENVKVAIIKAQENANLNLIATKLIIDSKLL